MTLEAAVMDGDYLEVRELVSSGSDPNHRNAEGHTMLMLASGLGHGMIVKQLLDAGADVLACEPVMGATALHKAAQSGRADVISRLLDHGAFIDQQSPVLGNTPLIDAVIYKNEHAVCLLLARGARTFIRNHWKQTALELAKADGSGPLAGLIEARDAEDAKLVLSLKLVAAVKANERDDIERLIAAGVDLNERTPNVGSLDDNYTPLAIAVRDGRSELARLLLEAGADPNQPIGLMRGTSIHEASYFGHRDVLDVLLDGTGRATQAGPALGEQGPYNGLTALHDAVWQGHMGAVQALTKAGAPLDLKTHTGETPRDLAIRYGYHELAVLLARAEVA